MLSPDDDSSPSSRRRRVGLQDVEDVLRPSAQSLMIVEDLQQIVVSDLQPSNEDNEKNEGKEQGKKPPPLITARSVGCVSLVPPFRDDEEKGKTQNSANNLTIPETAESKSRKMMKGPVDGDDDGTKKATQPVFDDEDQKDRQLQLPTATKNATCLLDDDSPDEEVGQELILASVMGEGVRNKTSVGSSFPNTTKPSTAITDDRQELMLASATGPVVRNTTRSGNKNAAAISIDNYRINDDADKQELMLASATGPVVRNTTSSGSNVKGAIIPGSSKDEVDERNATPKKGGGDGATKAGTDIEKGGEKRKLAPLSAGQTLSLATPYGEVSPMDGGDLPGASTTDRAFAEPATFKWLPIVTKQTPTNTAATADQQMQQSLPVGACRVGSGQDHGNVSSEMLSSEAMTAPTVDIKATPIAAELVQTSQDVEAIVEERIKQREADIAVAEVADISRDESVMFKVKVKRRKFCKIFWFVLVAAAITIGLIIGFVTKDNGEEQGDQSSENYLPEEMIVSGTTLEQVEKRGVLRCGADEFAIGFSFHNTTSGEVDGFLIDICRALAMAIFGDPDKIEMMFVNNNRFQLLRDNEIDVLTQLATVTMGRDALETRSGLGMTFSVPFYYTGLAFAGDPTFVDCADNLDSFAGPCRDLRMCIQAGGTTHEAILDELFPGPEITRTPNLEESVNKLESGECNVIANDSVVIPESLLRILGYTGPYKLGAALFSKEPLSLATRDGDAEWSKMVNMVINILYTAESIGITQNSVSSDALTEFAAITQDDHLASFFTDIISTVGNMGELYEKHIENIFPRQGLNLLNKGAGGLIYSFPLGDVEKNGELANGGIIALILERQKLRCGLSRSHDGRAEFDENSSTWSGLDVEFCVAVSAALFSSRGARTQIEFIELKEDHRLSSLVEGKIDIIAGERVSLQKMWQDPTTKVGYAFSPPYYYDEESGDSFALATLLQDDTQWSEFVFWVVTSTFYAEENDIGQLRSTELPVVDLFGESVKQMFLDTIWEVGNYGDIYNRTIESLKPRSNRNMINWGSTPQLLGFPLV